MWRPFYVMFRAVSAAGFWIERRFTRAGLLTLGALVGIWEVLCAAPDASLPPPSRVVSETWELIVDPFYDHGGIDKGLFWHIYASLKRVALGYLLAAIAGVALGVLVGSSKVATRALDPIFQVLRTIPPLAWLPLSLAAFRDGPPSAIFVIFITAIWPIIINTAVGIRNIPQDYQNVAKVLRLNRAEYFTAIMLPAAAPFIFTGLRIGVGLSWLARAGGDGESRPDGARHGGCRRPARQADPHHPPTDGRSGGIRAPRPAGDADVTRGTAST